MTEAINYALGQWQELNVFCADGAIPLNNNVSTAVRGSANIIANCFRQSYTGLPLYAPGTTRSTILPL
jgi:hypothetical protein